LVGGWKNEMKNIKVEFGIGLKSQIILIFNLFLLLFSLFLLLFISYITFFDTIHGSHDTISITF